METDSLTKSRAGIDLSEKVTLGWVEQTAEMLMKYHGLFLWSFKFDRAKNRFGYCQCAKKTISMSATLAVLRTREDCVNTILHEIAHALTPGCGHGPEWKDMATLIGARPERCSVTPHGAPEPRFSLICQECGEAVIKRHRRKDYSKKYHLPCGKQGHLYWRDNA